MKYGGGTLSGGGTGKQDAAGGWARDSTRMWPQLEMWFSPIPQGAL